MSLVHWAVAILQRTSCLKTFSGWISINGAADPGTWATADGRQGIFHLSKYVQVDRRSFASQVGNNAFQSDFCSSKIEIVAPSETTTSSMSSIGNPSNGLPGSQVILVGVSTEVTVGIALASFVIGVGLTAVLWCIHMRTGSHSSYENFTLDYYSWNSLSSSISSLNCRHGFFNCRSLSKSNEQKNAIQPEQQSLSGHQMFADDSYSTTIKCRSPSQLVATGSSGVSRARTHPSTGRGSLDG